MIRRISTVLLIATLAGLVGASACKSDSDAEKTTTPEESTEDTMAEPLDGWEHVDPRDLSDAKKRKLARAEQAKRDFGQTLIKTLTTAIGDGDFANAVAVCNTDAPQIAEKVSKEQDLEIGRTSFKLRNPDNAPPDWTQAYVDRRVEETIILDGPGDTVGYMSPIKMGKLCTNCHGPANAISPEVNDILAEKYPKDEATGFQEGDLRGWFWIRID